MSAQTVMPDSLRRMFEHLEIDVDAAFQEMPKEMQTALVTCRRCKNLERCDYDVQSRYFQCPNRDLLDTLYY